MKTYEVTWTKRNHTYTEILKYKQLLNFMAWIDRQYGASVVGLVEISKF